MSADADQPAASGEYEEAVHGRSSVRPSGAWDSPEALTDYLRYVRSIVPSEPVIHIDDSDVIKPEGYHFESLGIVRSGSRSTPEKSVFWKGYHVTEACVLTDSNHPVSIFSEKENI